MPSQYNEDAIIADFFGDRISSFCEIGSHDGYINNHTFALSERGWSGVCIEPSPMVFPYLLKRHANHPTVQCLNSAIDTESNIVEFYENNGDQMSTTETSHRDVWKSRGSTYSESFFICTVTFEQFRKKFPQHFPFLSIDVEGSNLRVLKAAPLSEMGVELVCVERDPDAKVKAMLIEKGYAKIVATSGNYLAHR